MKSSILSICKLKNEIAKELEKRRLSENAGDYSHKRNDNSVPLYGCTVYRPLDILRRSDA